MPPSRPNLDVERRQMLLDKFLRDYERDCAEGRSPRQLVELLERHIEADAAAFNRLSEKLDATKLEVARQEGKQEGIMDTGRFQLPPTQINIGAQSKRPTPSSSPLIEKIFARPAAIILSLLATLLAHALLKLLH